jgi:hypothetical protein
LHRPSEPIIDIWSVDLTFLSALRRLRVGTSNPKPH